MDRRLVGAAASLAGVGLLAWTEWGAYVNRTTERVPFTAIEQVGNVEIREYPETVVVATRAESEERAFRRLFEYIDGANRASESVSMTAPVATNGERATSGDSDDGAGSEEVSMTAPVRTDREGEGVRMEFFLPTEYTPESAPRPTHSTVELVIRPPRTVAALGFSGYARERKTTKRESKLLDTLDENGIETVGEVTLLQYNDPYTPPFMRHNEVAVDVDPESMDSND